MKICEGGKCTNVQVDGNFKGQLSNFICTAYVSSVRRKPIPEHLLGDQSPTEFCQFCNLNLGEKCWRVAPNGTTIGISFCIYSYQLTACNCRDLHERITIFMTVNVINFTICQCYFSHWLSLVIVYKRSLHIRSIFFSCYSCRFENSL